MNMFWNRNLYEMQIIRHYLEKIIILDDSFN